ncbi:cell division protein ZipA [Kangiella marina]|uniref:Cell division protein ZipA n=1 Tax=Kangiella marina TaxID=1079178 RepID=A0ABP8IB38_9GAMM
MEWQLAILLALVSLVIIGFIYFDAKRRSKVRKERVERELYQERLAKSRDNAGFDDDGIGQVRLVGDDNADDDGIDNEPLPEPEEPLQATRAEVESEPLEKLKASESLSDELQGDATHQDSEPMVTEGEQKEYVEPIISESDIPVLDDALFEFTKESLKKDQTKLEEANKEPKKEPRIEQPQQTSLFDEPDEEPSIEVEPELIFSLFVVAEQERPFKGPELIQSLVEQGMRHGEMDIFHRHAQANGRGAVQFSLANAFEPGIFELKKVDDLETRGLALFMTLPGPGKPMKAYDLMVKTAQGITKELGGYVLDATKSNFSKQIESHHREQIVEFERKQLLQK